VLEDEHKKENPRKIGVVSALVASKKAMRWNLKVTRKLSLLFAVVVRTKSER
jgi:hypothetical protein